MRKRPDRSGGIALAGLVVALLLGAVLRFHGLGGPGLWVDEAYTVEVARGSVSHLAAQLRADDAPPLYYLLQAGLVRVLGTSEFAVRTLSALASLGALLLLAAWARRFGAAAACLVPLLWATSTLSVFYAQQARSYALLHLGVAALLLLGTRLWETSRPAGAKRLDRRDDPQDDRQSDRQNDRQADRQQSDRQDDRQGDRQNDRQNDRQGDRQNNRQDDRRDRFAFVLVSLGLLYTHNLAVFSLIAAWIWILPAFRGRIRSLAAPLTFLGLGALPWGFSTLAQLGVHGELNAWMAGWWEGRSLLLGPLYSLAVFSNGAASWLRPPSPLPSLPSGVSLIVLLVWATVALGLGLALIRTAGWFRGPTAGKPGSTARPRSAAHARRAAESPAPLAAGSDAAPGWRAAESPAPRGDAAPGWRAAQTTTPLAAAAGAWLLLVTPLLGVLITTVLVGPAYVVGRTDTLALLPFAALLGIGWAGRPRLGAAGAALWLAVGLWVSFGPTPNPKGTDRALAAWMGSVVTPGDVVVVTALGRPTLGHYAVRSGWREQLGDLRAYPAELDRNPAAVYPTPLDSLPQYVVQARDLRNRWETAETPQVWVLATLNPGPRPGFPGTDSDPALPPASRSTVTANDLLYPMSVLVYTLRGLEPVDVLREYRQDWVGGERVALRIPRSQFVDPGSLRPIETESQP